MEIWCDDIELCVESSLISILNVSTIELKNFTRGQPQRFLKMWNGLLHAYNGGLNNWIHFCIEKCTVWFQPSDYNFFFDAFVFYSLVSVFVNYLVLVYSTLQIIYLKIAFSHDVKIQLLDVGFLENKE